MKIKMSYRRDKHVHIATWEWGGTEYSHYGNSCRIARTGLKSALTWHQLRVDLPRITPPGGKFKLDLNVLRAHCSGYVTPMWSEDVHLATVRRVPIGWLDIEGSVSTAAASLLRAAAMFADRSKIALHLFDTAGRIPHASPTEEMTVSKIQDLVARINERLGNRATSTSLRGNLHCMYTIDDFPFIPVDHAMFKGDYVWRDPMGDSSIPGGSLRMETTLRNPFIESPRACILPILPCKVLQSEIDPELFKRFDSEIPINPIPKETDDDVDVS